MDIVSLLLLQPDDQIREQCRAMDPRTLSRFSQTNKRINKICSDILAAHKEKYEKEKSELLQLFTEKVVIRNEGIFGEFNIDPIPGKNILMDIRPKYSELSNFLFRIPTSQSLESAQDTMYIIKKDVLSDQLKLDILRMAKKSGYTNVYVYRDIINRIYEYKSSLNDFSII